MCAQCDIKIIANQKVVTSTLKEIFKQRKIIVLERLGREGISRLKNVAICYDSISTGIVQEAAILETLSASICCSKNAIEEVRIVLFFKSLIFLTLI
jgi:hypothetical protein